jgi:hypothetical protein
MRQEGDAVSAHTCRTHDPDCYRCELSRDEVERDLPPGVLEGIRQAERGELIDLGSFAQYLDDD